MAAKSMSVTPPYTGFREIVFTIAERSGCIPAICSSRTLPHFEASINVTTNWQAAGATIWTTAASALLGLWVIASPFVYGITEIALWNAAIVGVLVAIIVEYNLYRRIDKDPVHIGGASLTAMLGLWLIASPWVRCVTGAGMLWSCVVGITIAIFSGYNAYIGREQ